MIDSGIVGKVRPALVLYYPNDDSARALAVVAPLTSQIRNAEGEVYIGKPKFLPKESAVNLQGIGSFDKRFIGFLYGRLPEETFAEVKTALRKFFNL